ncbi:MAG: hypothetical protein Q7R66_17745 [Undibacterium sp.]|uniref:hypothetical protein n=1 Tax=Undibacterium sp. TaxID=1914977 RepID=UPI0027250302|nr:hypothetical protein [Undibacterium sp.]MDO8654018.1 hypothetical protein [Undibacterium sp.]
MRKLTTTLIAAASILTGALAMWQLWPQEETAQAKTEAAIKRAAKEENSDEKNGNWPPPFPYQDATQDQVKRVALLPTETEMSATQSLLDTRNGDPRTPPIVRNTQEQELPSPDELADPKAYQQYEARQNLRLYSAFIQAAGQEVPRLQADVERAREIGIAPTDIAKVEEKIKRLAAMQAQLLREHPQLSAAAKAQ